MNLQKLFEAQRVLDEHILNEHPVQENENRLEKKILALQVELGECANEWRGFKFWSTDQEPRTRKYLTDYTEQDSHLGVGAVWVNPLLEEYVDCL
ncbi:dUTP diphosphatase, partial [Lysinibacillus halotolerans]